MVIQHDRVPRSHGIAFIGNYLPRKCGIATFTHDLVESVAALTGDRQQVSVCAMNDIPDAYDYPDRVRFEVRQDFLGDYTRAADYLNFSQVDAVCLQHEFGIFGGEEGGNILTLLRDLRHPFAVTCHTVLQDPLPERREVFEEICRRARKIIVMSKRAVSILEDAFGISRDKVALIPHGIHDVPFIDASYYKDKFGVEGRRVLLTFGLLSRNKGIEDVIEALPAIVERHPKVSYVVLGATHPHVIRMEGESYRLELQRRVRELGLTGNVMFLPRFVELEELLEYIGASDIMVTPYHQIEQITSGALSYAMGAGKAVVSTPYWHAEELLAEGRGCLVPVASPADIAKAVNGLLDDEVALSAMRKRAYSFCRHMVWGAVSRAYLDVIDEVRSHGPTTVSITAKAARLLGPADLPTPKLDHLIRISDDTGFAHHALRKLPDWGFGYWLEDAAAGLVASAKYYDMFKTASAAGLTERCLGLFHFMTGSGKEPAGQLDYTRRPVAKASEADLGRAIWASGYAVSHGPLFAQESANDVFNELVPRYSMKDLHGCAYATLGAADYLLRYSGASGIRKYLRKHAVVLADSLSEGWITQWRAANLGTVPQALAVASEVLGDRALADLASRQLTELIELTKGGKVFLNPYDNPDEEELPIFASTFIEALGALYNITEDKTLLAPMRTAANWFLGENQRGEALYDFTSGGCHDALTAAGVNQNQGTEATLNCVIAFLTLHEFIGIKSVSNADERRDRTPSSP